MPITLADRSKNRTKRKKTLPEEIYESMVNEPVRWKTDSFGYCLVRDDGLEIWISNGVMFVKLYRPQKIKFPRKWRKKIWKAYKERWKHLTINDVLGKK